MGTRRVRPGRSRWIDVALALGAVGAAVLVVLALTRDTSPPLTALDRPSISPSTPSEPDPVDLGGTDLATARDMLASSDPLVVSVLGDSTGNEPTEWVALWAEHLAQSRAVTLHYWDDVGRQWLPPEVLSTSGPTTHIWNMAAPGQKVSYPGTMIAQAQPSEPDLTIYNFGHNNTAQNFGGQLYSTMLAVRDHWGHPVPSLLILQNPSRGEWQERQEATVEAIREETAPLFDMATIDVFSAFEAEPNVAALLSPTDKLHPSPEGSQVWVDVVIEALG